MKRIKTSKLTIARETLRKLSAEQLDQVAGGTLVVTYTCPGPGLPPITGWACGSLPPIGGNSKQIRTCDTITCFAC